MSKAKVYEYKGKHYCEIDISLEDDDYEGDLFDLYWDMRQNGEACESTVYYIPENPEITYDDEEELVKNELEDYVIGEVEEE